MNQLTEQQLANREWAEQLRQMESDIEQIKFQMDAHLRARGWEHTSQTPGSYWRWIKMLPDGRTAMCDYATAVDIEQHTMDYGHLDTDMDGD